LAPRRVRGIPVAFDNIVTAVRVAAQVCGEPSQLAEAARSGRQFVGCCDSKLALNRELNRKRWEFASIATQRIGGVDNGTADVDNANWSDR
jgi:hypothetical protein